MKIEEYLDYRTQLLIDSSDDEAFFQKSLLLSEILPLMMDAKLIDSEDFNEVYFFSKERNIEINAYTVNESGERLQVFIIDHDSVNLAAQREQLLVSKKEKYNVIFRKISGLVKSFFSNSTLNDIQDSDPIRPLITKLASSSGKQQFDVIEIFFISLSSTVSLKSGNPLPKKFNFAQEIFTVTYQNETNQRVKKEVTLLKRLIDLNFLYDIVISQGNREPLKIKFKEDFKFNLKVLVAVKEKKFESYLCVFPAPVLADLYKLHSSRLLEKNIRSFLQFRGVNKGIRDTIKDNPEKFIAYNNGLTITATDKKIANVNNEYFIEELTDFQIVNGGQTTASIYFCNKDGLDVSKVLIMAKINVVNESDEDELYDLISNISEYSNAQSKVSKVDLRSRNPQLIKLKSLSDSIITPSGNKWFFERVKGDFNTQLRKAGSNKTRLNKDYPSSLRFTKEQLAKYYCSWGNRPYLVKKGGEKIFRIFIEEISNDDADLMPIDIDREFYENIISKIILFRSMEKIYGQGKSAMGQIRSSVIPYSISAIYMNSDGANSSEFNFFKIWQEQKVSDEFEFFLRKLMLLMNDLIKYYSKSEDFGEYSKKEELWIDISNSLELKQFFITGINNQILGQYLKSYHV